MKRVGISIAILVIIAVLAISSAFYTRYTTDKMLSYFDQAEKEISTGNIPMLMDTLDEMQLYYAKHDKWLMLLVRRDFVTNPQCSFCVLPSYATEENKADFCTELNRARIQIVQLRDLFFSIL